MGLGESANNLVSHVLASNLLQIWPKIAHFKDKNIPNTSPEGH